MHPYLPQTVDDCRAMLATIGAASVEELFNCLPPEVRLKGGLKLPKGMNEMELARAFSQTAARNTPVTAFSSFLGAGAYERHIPAVVKHLAGRSEFYTAYTPYQPEITQGMLQAIYEYQSLICGLTGMDVSNASLYEGGHALAEAVLMACQATGRKKVVLAAGTHPEYLAVLKTYGQAVALDFQEAGLDPEGLTSLAAMEKMVDDQTAAVVFSNPNFFGCLQEGSAFSRLAHAKGALLVACVEPVSLGLVSPPGEYDADIACGEGQSLGLPLSFGGPYLGFIACKQSLVRRMPGRLAGQTLDNRGQRGFVLTLQTREQHIRREKAASNICSNESLMALCAAIYLCALGPLGLKEVASLSLQNAHYLAEGVRKIKGVSLAYAAPFFCEFTLKLPAPADGVEKKMREKGILAGVPLARFFKERTRELLVCATETKTREQLDAYLAALKSALRKGS